MEDVPRERLFADLCFEFGDAIAEGGIGFEAMGDGLTGMYDGGVSATTDGHTDACSAERGMLLGEIHDDLSRENDVGLAA